MRWHALPLPVLEVMEGAPAATPRAASSQRSSAAVLVGAAAPQRPQGISKSTHWKWKKRKKRRAKMARKLQEDEEQAAPASCMTVETAAGWGAAAALPSLSSRSSATSATIERAARLEVEKKLIQEKFAAADVCRQWLLNRMDPGKSSQICPKADGYHLVSMNSGVILLVPELIDAAAASCLWSRIVLRYASDKDKAS